MLSLWQTPQKGASSSMQTELCNGRQETGGQVEAEDFGCITQSRGQTGSVLGPLRKLRYPLHSNLSDKDLAPMAQGSQTVV